MPTTNLTSKPPFEIDPNWITWSLNCFANPDPHSKLVTALIYVTCKRDISMIFKPTPMKDWDGKLKGIIGNIFNKKSAPAFTKIDGDKIGSCFAIQQHSEIPTKSCPMIVLEANIVKDTEWEFAEHDIALCVVPILPLSPLVKILSLFLLMIRSSKKWARSPLSTNFGLNKCLMSLSKPRQSARLKPSLQYLSNAATSKTTFPATRPHKGLGPTPSLIQPLLSLLPSLAEDSLQSKRFSKIIFCPEPHSCLRQRNSQQGQWPHSQNSCCQWSCHGCSAPPWTWSARIF